MLSNELLKAVKHLEIVARRAVNDQLAGAYHSIFKGRGMDFLDVREYQPGDDIRVIDWNVSARTGELHVKRFVEERELSVFILVDASGSQTFGTHNRRKQTAAAELAALIAFSAIKNNDRIGLIRFTDRIETFIEPKKGRKHVMRVITEILRGDASSTKTDLNVALDFLSKTTKKHTVAFLISDFIDTSFERSLRIAHRRHELIPLVIIDPMEERLPDMGIVHFEDPESGEILTVDTSNRDVRDQYQRTMTERHTQRDHLFRRLKMDSVTIRTDRNHIDPLVHYFRQRARRNS